MFRRRPPETHTLADDDQPGQLPAAPETDRPGRPGLTPAKGRPTPKRSESEASRRAPYRAPADRKTAYRQSRKQGRSDRARRTEAQQRGEQWALPPKDRGPVRALARDVADSHHGVAEYYLIAVIPIFVLILLPVPVLKVIADVLVLLMLVAVIGESYFIGLRVQRLAQERFPGESSRGVRMYAALRVTQMRRIRIPKPRVSRGDPV